MDSHEKIQKLREKQGKERAETKEKERAEMMERRADLQEAANRTEPDLLQVWGRSFADDGDEAQEEPGFALEVVEPFEEMPGIVSAVPWEDIQRVAGELVLLGAEADRAQIFCGKVPILGVVLLGDPRIAAEVARLSGARLVALAGLVPEAYRAALTDDSEEVGAKNVRATMARDLANRLGWQAAKPGKGGGADDWRAQRVKDRKTAEARHTGGK